MKALLQHDNAMAVVGPQILWAGLGLLVMLVVMRIDYRYLRLVSVPGYLLAIALLCLVFVPQFNRVVGGSARWLAIGPLPAVHPAEFAKLALVRLSLGRPEAARAALEQAKRLQPTDEVRELRLQLGIAPHQRIILCVGNLRRVLGMVEPIVLRDLNSTNGTWIGRERITEVELDRDTEIKIGSATIQFHVK